MIHGFRISLFRIAIHFNVFGTKDSAQQISGRTLKIALPHIKESGRVLMNDVNREDMSAGNRVRRRCGKLYVI